jgi:hypothetical protein
MNRSTPPHHPKPNVWKRRLTGLLKLAISLGLLAFLFWKAAGDENFQNLRDQPKNWTLLAAALLVALTAVTTTFVRWYLLVRAVEIPFTVGQALRLGFLGYLFNFFPAGAVGGDAVRAGFIARDNPGRRTVAVATVIVDRVFGLVALFLLVSVSYFALDWNSLHARRAEDLQLVRTLCWIGIGGAAAGLTAFGVFLSPGFQTSPWWDFLARLPKVGPIFAHLIEALRMYRRRLPVLGVVLGMSLCVHFLLAVAIYLIAQGLPGDAPGFGAHLIVSPMAGLAGTIPLPAGPYEVVLDFLYHRISPDTVAESQGFVIAIAYRAMTLVIAMIGMGYFLASRREVKTLMEEAQRDENETEGAGERGASAP